MIESLARLLTSIAKRLLPAVILRSAAAQQQVDDACKALTLYHYPGCPFCFRVRRQVKRLSLDIEQRNIHGSPGYARELIEGGGKNQVPCLLIRQAGERSHWLYESAEINRYLRQHFDSATTADRVSGDPDYNSSRGEPRGKGP